MSHEAIFRGKPYYVWDFDERTWRDASRNSEILCAEEGCTRPNLFYREGSIIKRHFAHPKGALCNSVNRKSEESEEHALCKSYLELIIPQFNRVLEIRKEVRRDPTRPDVYVRLPNGEVGVEVQCSPLEEFDVEEKFRKNAANNLFTMYLFHEPMLKPDEYHASPSSKTLFSIGNSEKLLHFLNWARLYYFSINPAATDISNAVHIKSLRLGPVKNESTGYNLRNVRTVEESFNLANLCLALGRRENQHYPEFGRSQSYLLAKFRQDR
jgi:hypothetical protein